jgi:hypothetical protein
MSRPSRSPVAGPPSPTTDVLAEPPVPRSRGPLGWLVVLSVLPVLAVLGALVWYAVHAQAHDPAGAPQLIG